MKPIFALLCAALSACRQPVPPSQPQPPAGEVWITPQQQEAAQIATAPAEERDIPAELVAGARISFDEQRLAHVFSPVSGRVVQVFVRVGDAVKPGMPLASVDAPDAGSALADAEKARADLVAARREVKRQRELVEAQAGARRDLETAEDAAAKADSELQRAKERARLLGSRGRSQIVTIRSPIAGELIARFVNPGSEIQGQLGGGAAQELVTVGSLESVKVYADVFEQDLPSVRAGAPVKVVPLAHQGTGRQPYQGNVDWIAPQLDAQTRTAKVRVTLANPDRELRAEMYATAAIAAPGRRALAIPRNALLRLGDQSVVFVELPRGERGLLRFERRSVVAADVPGDLLPVERGLQAGERVVTSGAILLSGLI
jgi:cobalt-zinc-cadmium efflux system membrane fusion protein